MIQDSRIKYLSKHRVRRGDFVLYWMQASQRSEYNHALEYAVRRANELRKPLLVFFGLTGKFPRANLRHYFFMLQGLRQVKAALERRGIRLVIRKTSPESGAEEMGKRCSLVVVDRGYLRIQRRWRKRLAERAKCPVIQVESDVVVPIEEVSDKEEYAARTIRPRIKRLVADYLEPLVETEPAVASLDIEAESLDIEDIDGVLNGLGVDDSVTKVEDFQGGTSFAKRRFEHFLENKLDVYHEYRNDPNRDALSGMSPYLHFGQISPLYLALLASEQPGPGADAFLEELIVRRELSCNYTYYNPNYDQFEGLPQWSKMALEDHQSDPRPHLYSLEKLEGARTHDPYWNAAQEEMLLTGKMHGYLRMYWGKKILEWSKDPGEAFDRAIYLNDKYELDGRDPNSYAGVAWCFGKHDRPWSRRPVFGTVRSMTSGGLRRKFDPDAYVEKIKSLMDV